MRSMTLKNVPEPLLEAVREAAKEERRSLNQEAIHLLELGLKARRNPLPESGPRAAEHPWTKLAGKWRSDVDPAEEIEEIYRRRTAGRDVDL